MSDHSTVKLSDPVTICLRQALQKLRVARGLSPGEGDSPRQSALITTAVNAVQDALDGREES